MRATVPVPETACHSLVRRKQPKMRVLTKPGRKSPDVISYEGILMDMITIGCKMKER
jgi:hypothetical protein